MWGAIIGGVTTIGAKLIGWGREKSEQTRATERQRIEQAGTIRIAAMRAMGGFVSLYVVAIWTAPVVAGFYDPEQGRAMVTVMESYPGWFTDGFMAVSAAALGLKALGGR